VTKYYTIYKITHVPSGKFYVGRHVTTDLDDGYMGSGKYIKNAIEKYGPKNFKKEYLYVFYDEYFMFLHEEAIVTEEFCKRKDTYNIAPGGFGGGWTYINSNLPNGMHGKRHSSSTKKMISERSGKSTPGFKGTQLNWTGRKHSEETKRKMSETLKKKSSGSKNSQYGTMWITNGTESKKISKDHEIPEGYRRGRILS